VIKSYSISYMHFGKNMAKIVKFIFFLIIFISVFLVAMNRRGNPFLDVLNFLNYFLYSMLSHLSNTLLFSFFITRDHECEQDFDCPKSTCMFSWKPTCVKPYFLMVNQYRYNYCACTWAMCLLRFCYKIQWFFFDKKIQWVFI